MRRGFDFHNDKLMYPTLKHMGYMDWWLSYRTKKGGSYTTAKTVGNYKVEIEDDERYPNIYIWNPKSPCVMIAIDKQDKIGVLNRLVYNPKCTIDGKMKRGEDTKKMIEFAFKVAKEYGVTKIQLTDKSTVDCNGVEADLALYNLFKYGKTWYERTFQFYPVGSRKDTFESIRSKLPTLSYPCDYFSRENSEKLYDTYNLDVLHAVIFEKIL